MNCRGTAPPTTLSTNSKPAALPAAARPRCRRPRTGRARRTASRAGRARRRGLRSVSRSATRTGSVSTSTPCRVRSRSSSTSRCASPIDHSTIWCVSGVDLHPHRGVLGDQPGQPLHELVLVAAGPGAETAVGSSGSGIVHGSISAGAAGVRQRVPGLRAARAGRPPRRRRPGRASTGVSAAPSGMRHGADALVHVVVGVPVRSRARRHEPGEVPGDVHGRVRHQRCRRTPGPARAGRRTGRSWSCTTSATSGPSGSQADRLARLARPAPSRSAAGAPAATGSRAPSPRAARRRRGRSPPPPAAPGGTTPRATAVSRSATRVSKPTVLARQPAVEQACRPRTPG